MEDSVKPRVVVTPSLKYLTHYPEPLQAQVRALIAENRLGEVLRKRYPEPNMVRTDKALQ